MNRKTDELQRGRSYERLTVGASLLLFGSSIVAVAVIMWCMGRPQ